MNTDVQLEELVYDPSNPNKIKLLSFQKACRLVFPEGITTIPPYFCQNNSHLYEVVFPETLSLVDAWAFQECVNLRKVQLPKKRNVSIEIGAFRNCNSLEDISFENICSIGGNAFTNCALKSIHFSKDLSIIRGYAFEGCDCLQEISIPSNITLVGESAFRNCIRLTKVIFEPRYQKYQVKGNAFQNCINLKTVIFSDGLTEIDESMFKNCESLENIHLSKSIRFLKKEAFKNCTHLKEISIENVFEVNESCFEGCKNLSCVVVGKQLNRLGESAFSKCSSLKSIAIPDSISSIGKGAFRSCYRLNPFFRLKVLTL